MRPARRMPGIYFEVERQPSAPELPRMDIAGLVGIAERGPLDTPVTVESAKHFTDIFGGTVALAWDNREKRYQYSQLAAAVDQFFRNGGRRCRVVRVAHKEDPERGIVGAQRRLFVLPDVFEVNGDALDAVTVTARSVGHWADRLRIATRLKIHALGLNRQSASGSAFQAESDSYALHVHSTPSDLQQHDLIEVIFIDPGLRLYLFVDELEPAGAGNRVHARTAVWFREVTASPDSGDFALERMSQEDGLLAYQNAVPVDPERGIIIRRLRMDLVAWDNGAPAGRLQNLAFHSRHPRYWGRLPNDERLFAGLSDTGVGGGTDYTAVVIPEAVEPRFPFSVWDTEEDNEAVFYIPIEMGTQTAPADSGGPISDGGLPPYVRNGLEFFDADLFLDPALASVRGEALQGEAFHKRYIEGEKLTGIHTLLRDPDVSLISIPDSVHRRWDQTLSPFTLPMPAPYRLTLSEPDRHDSRRLNWEGINGVRRYIVQASDNPGFETAEEYTVERPDPLSLFEPEETGQEAATELRFLLPADHADVQFFRVRAEGYHGLSPWSETLSAKVSEYDFDECGQPAIAPVMVHLDSAPASPEDGSLFLNWYLTGDAGSPESFDGRFELEQAHDMDFGSGRIVYRGESTGVTVDPLYNQPAYFRVRAVRGGEVGPWSNTLIGLPRLSSRQTVNTVDEYTDTDLLAVHCAAMRLCAADTDKVAILSLPQHYNAGQVLRHVDRLLAGGDAPLPGSGESQFGSGRSKVPSLTRDERHTDSYGALFYPWLYVNAAGSRGSTSLAAACPPDGAICGRMAVTANRRGAWISSANDPLANVVGVVDQFDLDSGEAMLGKQVNLIGMRTGDCMATFWSTLSRNSEVRSLSVRRLMTLLSRLVRRDGHRHVFEPNSNQLRRAVRAYWEKLLSGLYRRGALRGNKPDDAFRVVTGDEVNDRIARDSGRFYVELRLAPSKPMSFITVKLSQTAGGQLSAKEL